MNLICKYCIATKRCTVDEASHPSPADYVAHAETAHGVLITDESFASAGYVRVTYPATALGCPICWQEIPAGAPAALVPKGNAADGVLSVCHYECVAAALVSMNLDVAVRAYLSSSAPGWIT